LLESSSKASPSSSIDNSHSSRVDSGDILCVFSLAMKHICRIHLFLRFAFRISSCFQGLLFVRLLGGCRFALGLRAIDNDVSRLPTIIANNLLILLPLPYSTVVELDFVVHSPHIFLRRDKSSSPAWSSSSSSEMVEVDLKARVFFFWGVFSSLDFLFISWVFRFLIRPMISISSLSFSSFKVVDLTSQDDGIARMTFLTFWSLSISSPEEARPFVVSKLGDHITNSFIFIHAKNFILEHKRSILALLTCDIPSCVTTRCDQISWTDLH